MARLLILYPAIFTCHSKFERKVQNLIQRLENIELLYLDDPNGFIGKLTNASAIRLSSRKIDAITDEQFDYAIIFDDGEEFEDETIQIKQAGVAARWVNIKLTRVINLKREADIPYTQTTAYEYIGRGSYWGNPHAMFEAGEDRQEVIRKYQYDFQYDKFINIDPQRVHELAGKRLGCYCAPANCHGDVLADFLNGFDDGT